MMSRYLRLLGLDRPPAGPQGLEKLVRRHLCRVPFENLTKLLLYGREGAGRVTRMEEFLDGIESQDLGGTCYTSNPFLAWLLRALGYDADLLGADMSVPNIHTAIRVRIGRVEYHVDVGYAAPFRQPMRLDRLPYRIAHGQYEYVLDRHPRGYEVTVLAGAERAHGYVVHGPPRAPEFFNETILDSFGRGRTFMSYLRITRFFDDHAIELKNRTVTTFRGGESSQRTVESLAELESAVATDFAMPRCPVRQAVEVLEQVTGTPFFASERCPEGF